MDSRHFAYKMTVDNGGAPCVANGLLTLAICKPQIRSSARVGDWVYAFGGGRLGGRLIYIAQVNDKLINGAYFRTRDYQNRADRIYKYEKRRYVRRKSARYHKGRSDLLKDLGEPPGYSRANVLLSCHFRYLGDTGEKISGRDFPLLTKLLNSLKQGHRVNYDVRIVEELEKLRNEIWSTYREKIVGMPSDKDYSKRCSGGSGPVKVCANCGDEGC